MKTNESSASFNIDNDKMSKILLEDIRSISMTSFLIFFRDFRTFPIKLSPIIDENSQHALAKVQWTFANCQLSNEYAGECPLNFHQLATFQGIQWPMSIEYIGKNQINVYLLKWSIRTLRDTQEFLQAAPKLSLRIRLVHRNFRNIKVEHCRP